MSRKLLIAASIALSSALMPLVANADDKQDSSPMTKDAWLSEMNSALPHVVCKGFMEDEGLKKRFDELKIDKTKCESLIPAIGTKCQEEIYSKIPAMIDDKSASTWGEALGECIGKNFAEEYLIPKN